MRLRVRHPNGASTLDSVTPEQTIATLKEIIATEIGVPWQQIEVAGGYPPRKYTNDADTLKVAGIRNGDALNVKVTDAPAQPAPSTSLNQSQQQQQPPQQRTLQQPTESLGSADVGEAVETSGGYLALRTVPDDNSCLFRALGYVLSRDTSMSQELRSVIAATIQEDPVVYSDATLGQSREQYIDWIRKNSSWGGAIEISIFSKHFDIEIDSIDVQTGRIDRFGEGSYSERVLIIYSGIHYDALALAPMADAPADFDQTRFPVDDDHNSLLEAAKKLAGILRQKRKFTDVANFTLKCNQCLQGLVGEKDAREHATATGHTHFVEY
ncbi:hypothetical protein BDB00DRAFT_842563 [Zychaea mexicana]|uniref:uncharacterized protein n=1 Tax=Zychaea mexicana TaxID=64656 RepID=UPI0022FF13B6|nr:uncharacterized protein BDB00DRAFT_842563 [Zychaea mexicana]KAI9489575.1 hypothetical protein BDB00DRAFT_842563 [Zychaea mexicana]